MEMQIEAKYIINNVTEFMNRIQKENYQNEQWVLDFCDELNKLSIEF
jgi:hypothetical protein